MIHTVSFYPVPPSSLHFLLLAWPPSRHLQLAVLLWKNSWYRYFPIFKAFSAFTAADPVLTMACELVKKYMIGEAGMYLVLKPSFTFFWAGHLWTSLLSQTDPSYVHGYSCCLGGGCGAVCRSSCRPPPLRFSSSTSTLLKCYVLYYFCLLLLVACFTKLSGICTVIPLKWVSLWCF